MPAPSPIRPAAALAPNIAAAFLVAGLAIAAPADRANAEAPPEVPAGGLTDMTAERLADIEALITEGDARAAAAALRGLYLDLSAQAGFAPGKIALTRAPATGFGAYEPRPDNRFAPGAPVHVYVELNGVGVIEHPEGIREMRFEVDFALNDAQGAALTDTIPMGKVQLQSRSRAADVFLELTYNLTGVPPGDYLLWTRITDTPSGQQVEFDKSITIARDN